jgi:hypothetical protein
MYTKRSSFQELTTHSYSLFFIASLLHLIVMQVVKDLMPVCSFFLDGLCSKEDCPYLHINYSPDTLICRPFLNGYCPRGAACPKQHLSRRMAQKLKQVGSTDANVSRGMIEHKQVTGTGGESTGSLLKRKTAETTASGSNGTAIIAEQKVSAGRRAMRVRAMGLGLSVQLRR